MVQCSTARGTLGQIDLLLNGSKKVNQKDEVILTFLKACCSANCDYIRRRGPNATEASRYGQKGNADVDECIASLHQCWTNLWIADDVEVIA